MPQPAIPQQTTLRCSEPAAVVLERMLSHRKVHKVRIMPTRPKAEYMLWRTRKGFRLARSEDIYTANQIVAKLVATVEDTSTGSTLTFRFGRRLSFLSYYGFFIVLAPALCIFMIDGHPWTTSDTTCVALAMLFLASWRWIFISDTHESKRDLGVFVYETLKDIVIPDDAMDGLYRAPAKTDA
jgi:hypothetical protein